VLIMPYYRLGGGMAFSNPNNRRVRSEARRALLIGGPHWVGRSRMQGNAAYVRAEPVVTAE
jgi:hypothetical protein